MGIDLEECHQFIELVCDVCREAEVLDPCLRGHVDLGHALTPPLLLPLLRHLTPGNPRPFLRLTDHLLHELLGDVFFDEVDEDVIPSHVAPLERLEHPQSRGMDGYRGHSIGRHGSQRGIDIILIVAPSGFEPLSPAPKASMLGLYTTGLAAVTTGHR